MVVLLAFGMILRLKKKKKLLLIYCLVVVILLKVTVVLWDLSVCEEWRLNELEGQLPDRVLVKMQATIPPLPVGSDDHCY